MRSPASAFENRPHGAEKIGSGRYSDFFNGIGQFLPRHLTERAASLIGRLVASTF
jgi:hypothetical protein